MSISNVRSVLIISYLILVTISMLIAWMLPSEGYEASIYVSSPIIVWITIIIGYVLTIIFLIKDRFYDIKKIDIRILFPMIFSSIFLISMYRIRSYLYVYIESDSGVHLGKIHSLINTAVTDSYYPGSYFETSILTLVSGVDCDVVFNIIPIIFVMVLLIGINLLLKRIYIDKWKRYVGLFFACLLPFGATTYMSLYQLPSFVPHTIAFTLFPLFLYVVLSVQNGNSRYSKRWLVLSLILLICILITHVLVYIVCIAFLFSYIIQTYIRNKGYFEKVIQLKQILWMIISSLIIFGLWTSIIRLLFPSSINNIYLGFTSLIVDDISATETSANFANRISLLDLYSYADIIEIFIRQLGLFVLSLLIIALSLYMIQKNKSYLDNYSKLIPFFIFLLPLGMLYLITFVADLSFQPGRIGLYFTLIAILLSGFVLSQLIYDIKKSKNILRYIIIVGIILFIALYIPFSMMSVYHSYHTLGSARVIALSEIDGMEFYFDYTNYDYDTIGTDVPITGFITLFYSTFNNIENNNKQLKVFARFTKAAPPQFNLSAIDTATWNDQSKLYLLIVDRVMNNIDKLNKMSMYNDKYTPKWTYNDLQLVGENKSVIKCYDSPIIKLYTITKN